MSLYIHNYIYKIKYFKSINVAYIAQFNHKMLE